MHKQSHTLGQLYVQTVRSARLSQTQCASSNDVFCITPLECQFVCLVNAHFAHLDLEVCGFRSHTSCKNAWGCVMQLQSQLEGVVNDNYFCQASGGSFQAPGALPLCRISHRSATTATGMVADRLHCSNNSTSSLIVVAGSQFLIVAAQVHNTQQTTMTSKMAADTNKPAHPFYPHRQR